MKKIIPGVIKTIIKNIWDFIFWTSHYRKLPVMIENDYKIKYLIYPYNKNYFNTEISALNRKKEYSALKKLLPGAKVIFDVGANFGSICIYLAKNSSNPEVKIYAFEPVSDTFDLLKETIALNRVDTIYPINLALSDHEGKSNIYKFDQKDNTLNSLGDVRVGDLMPKSTEVVELETIDNFSQKYNIAQIDILKIDVEGFEENVLLGASSMLKNKQVKFIQFEISKQPLESIGKKAESVFSILRSYNYKVYSYDVNKSKFEGPITKESSIFDNYYASTIDLSVF